MTVASSSCSSSTGGPIVAFLGPPGTYSHQAVSDHFGQQATYRPCRTISDVFHHRPSAAPECAQGWHVALPFENSKNGIVVETLDLLLSAGSSKGKGREWTIERELRVDVRHCLVVRADFEGELAELESVKSHEQALAQCQTFLSTSLPSAKRVPTPSTAGAAESLLLPGGERSAAICARAVVDVVPGLKVARQGIEDMTGNTTRFLLLRHAPSPSASSKPTSSSLLRPSTRQLHLYSYLPSSPSYPSFDPPRDLYSRATSSQAPVLRAVDRRPVGDGRSAYLVCYETIVGNRLEDESWLSSNSEGGGGWEGERDEWEWVGSWAEYGQEAPRLNGSSSSSGSA